MIFFTLSCASSYARRDDPTSRRLVHTAYIGTGGRLYVYVYAVSIHQTVQTSIHSLSTYKHTVFLLYASFGGLSSDWTWYTFWYILLVDNGE